MSPPRHLIDSHCHLDRFDPSERTELLERARSAGLAGMVTIGTRLSEAETQIGLTGLSTAAMPVWCTIGTHPDHVPDEPEPQAEALAERACAPMVVGIGESGLDYLHATPEQRPAQQHSFQVHIRAARLADLPLVIHARQADDDILAILRDEHESGGPFRFLLHCFSSGARLAEAALALGGSISFSGMLTFPKLAALRDIARSVPGDRLLVETDAPFLAPVPHRGRRNEPAYVVHTASLLAELRGVAPSDLHARTRENFHRLFSKAA